MGAVFEVEDEVLKRRLALKVVDVPLDGEAPAEALLGEARVLARLEHPGLVPVHDAGRLPDGRAFYAMKLVQGNVSTRLSPGSRRFRSGCASFCECASPWRSRTQTASSTVISSPRT